MHQEDTKYKVNLKNAKGQITCIGRNQNVIVNTLLGVNEIESLHKVKKFVREIEKLKGKPTIITDVSTIKTEKALWKFICEETEFIASTVPIYFLDNKLNLCEKELLAIIKEQVECGVGIITIHPIVSKKLIELANKRITPWTSRGGNIIIKYFQATEENIYMKILEDIISLCKKHKTVISIGTSFRPANIIDSYDEAQILELNSQIELADYITEQGVGVIIEAPGHASPRKIEKIAKILSKSKYPIMPLGPISTDIAIGNDHISASLGAMIMGLQNTVQIISAVTREEHTGNIPSEYSILESIETANVTAHVINLYRNENYEKDEKIAKNRRNSCLESYEFGCSRCGELCPLIS